MATPEPQDRKSPHRLVAVDLDNSLRGIASADVDHERRVAIFDLIESNLFRVNDHDTGPYKLKLSIADNRLVFDIASHDGEPCIMIGLALSSFRRIVKDYFMICESYYQSIRNSTPSQIETIDMHNEGSELLKSRLNGKVEVDFNTARRLFTLICVLHWRG
jgi:uncharacterized protein (UPF0262 family)